MKNMKEQLELDALGESLKKIQKPRLEPAKKFAMKSKLMSKLEAPVVQYIQSQDAKLEFDMTMRARIKERVFALIEMAHQKRFFWSNFFLFQKKFVGAVALVSMMFYMFVFMTVEPNVVFAHSITVLDSFGGEIVVQRDGEAVDVEEGMEIYENDRIVTGIDGEATVKFFDDSVSRLSSNTEIVINKLFRPEGSFVRSYVEVNLVGGVMWSKVLNLVESESSFVVQSTDVAVAARRAAFNIEVAGSEVEVGVYRNVVDVTTSSEVEKVVSGEKVTLAEDSIVQVKKIDEAEKDSDWVKKNLDSDMKYVAEVEEALLAAKIKSVGSEVEDDFEIGNSIKEDAVLFLTFDDVETKRIELDLAEKNFIAAEIKLNDEGGLSDEEKVEVQNAISVYSDTVADYVDFVDEIRVTDSEYADELDQYVEEKILLQKKNLSLMLPDSPAYEIKEVVDELELLIAEDEIEEVKIISEQQLTKLSEVEDVLEQGDTELAEQIVDEYKEEVNEMIQVIDSLDEKEVVLKEELIENIEEGIELLDAIVEAEVVKYESVVEVIVEEEYGIVIEGDKPLSPLLVQ